MRSQSEWIRSDEGASVKLFRPWNHHRTKSAGDSIIIPVQRQDAKGVCEFSLSLPFVPSSDVMTELGRNGEVGKMTTDGVRLIRSNPIVS